jgi:hypothetical protein
LTFFEQQKRDLKAMFAKTPDALTDRSEEQTPFAVWFGGTVLLMIATFFIYSFYFSHFGVLAWHTIGLIPLSNHDSHNVNYCFAGSRLSSDLGMKSHLMQRVKQTGD